MTGLEGLLINVIENKNLIMVSGFRQRMDQSAGPAELSGQIRLGDFITHINRVGVTWGDVEILTQMRASQACANGGTLLVHLGFHAPIGKAFPPTADTWVQCATPSAKTDTWVQCAKCSKWRTCPGEIADDLPDDWECKSNAWELTMASCDAPEKSWDVEENKIVDWEKPKESTKVFKGGYYDCFCTENKVWYQAKVIDVKIEDGEVIRVKVRL